MNVNDAAVVFYSEQPFVVETLISAFGKSPGFRLAAVHDTVEATLEFLAKHSADADIVLLNFNGELTLSILQRIKRSAPFVEAGGVDPRDFKRDGLSGHGTGSPGHLSEQPHGRSLYGRPPGREGGRAVV
jgi:hypothetical protein